MGRKRRRNRIDSLINVILYSIVFVVIGIYGAISQLSNEDKGILIALIVGLVVIGIIIIVVILKHVANRRRETWERAMMELGRTENDSQCTIYRSTLNLTPRHLEKFSAQLFRAMGYRVTLTGKTGDHGIDVRLINPNGGIELVQCKQFNKPVGEPVVRDLAGAMSHAMAKKGYIIAPGGFTYAARKWVRGKPIDLVDDRRINQMVEIVYGSK